MVKRRSRGQLAQSLVEFAVVFPVFMAILAGMIQLGVILWASNTLNQAVRDTGRFAATLDCSAGAQTTAEAAFTDPILKNAGGPWKNPTVDVTFVTAAGAPTTICPDDGSTVVWVNVSASMDAIVFFPLVPGNGHVSSSTTFRVEPAP